ncbi:MAG: DUF5706 domain-containing protein [Rhizobiaceae bacterium]|nr:DUF5706 domain-containing protein [Rhizobiaceae bacterium]MCV0407982.1 DUF5706 domain-containing protein [Rhizobiaceae bacterium]
MNEKTVDQLASAVVADKPFEQIVEKSHYLDHLTKVNDVFYDQIRIADQKAAYLFTFMLAFLVTSADGRGVFTSQRYMTDPWPLAAASAILGLAVLTTLFSAIMVVLPRRAAKGTSLYWGSWAESRERFLEANRTGDPDFLTREYLGNVDNLSAIARRKFRFVGIAFRGLLTAIGAYVALLALK